jgi:hypothetical protein
MRRTIWGEIITDEMEKLQREKESLYREAEERGETTWNGNPHWMRRVGEEAPTHDPAGGCESCGWVEDGGIRESDLIWSPAACAWLCMDCD